MPLPTLSSLLDLLQLGIEGGDALARAKRTDRVRPFALAGSGFMILLLLGGLLDSTLLLASSVLPAAVLCWWGAWQAWSDPEIRRPVLTVALVVIGASFALYSASVGAPTSWLPVPIAMRLFWISLAALGIGLILALGAWWRDEWSEI